MEPFRRNGLEQFLFAAGRLNASVRDAEETCASRTTNRKRMKSHSESCRFLSLASGAVRHYE
jgi:hypothetical protein